MEANSHSSEQERQMRNDMVILVNENDEEIGQSDKYQAHIRETAKLHRAFSVFLFDEEGKLCLQQRSQNKLTFPMIWANTCCSHPSPGETILHAAVRRTKFELNIDLNEIELKECNTILYRADWGQQWTEWEIDHLVIGKYNNKNIQPNPEEVNSIKWLSENELANELSQNQESYSPWLRYIWEQKLLPKFSDI